MRVALEKYGGLAAFPGLRRQPQVVDTASLPKHEAAELSHLVAAARAEPADDAEGPGRGRDAMSYTITVEDGGQSTTLSRSDTTMSPAFAALLSWLEGHAAGK